MYSNAQSMWVFFYRWYKFDDVRVYEIDPSTICSSEAYILFYCRKN